MSVVGDNGYVQGSSSSFVRLLEGERSIREEHGLYNEYVASSRYAVLTFSAHLIAENRAPV